MIASISASVQRQASGSSAGTPRRPRTTSPSTSSTFASTFLPSRSSAIGMSSSSGGGVGCSSSGGVTSSGSAAATPRIGSSLTWAPSIR